MLLEAGAQIIQLRIKNLSIPKQREAVRLACRAAEKAPGSQLFINDYWHAALEHGAFGIHLGQEDLLAADLTAITSHGARLGISSHSYWEVARAKWLMPSYLACGPIFPTRAKAMNWIPQGLDNLRYWVSISHVPIVAIAGINASNLEDIVDQGANAAAVIQAIASAEDPVSTYKKLRKQWDARKAVNQPPEFHRSGGGSESETKTAVAPARPTLALA
jgi:hydroxymethylpyrimidine kinase/phosphomethylpyrimidine kinase/thiamine-phosphate diphosphorylase